MNDCRTHQSCILLVEDEALIALSETRTLEKFGYQIITAHSGEKAVETATEDTAINLVLMDIDLGSGIDGTEAAQRILQARSLPIVFLTSHAEKEYVERVKSITNYGYVLKGSGEFVLNESINMALQLFEAHQETASKEERLSFVVNEAPVGIFQSSSDGTFRHLNSEMARILGFDSPEEALHYYTDIGQQIYTREGRREEFFSLIEEQGVVRDFRFEIVRVTGEKAYLKMNAHRLPNSGETEMLINAFVVDETERQQAEQTLEESQKQYQSVVDLAQEIIVRHDIEGKWTFVNEAACQFFGQTREELIGQHYMDYMHPEDRDEANAALRTMTDDGADVDRLVNRQWTPRGYRIVEWNSSPFTDEHGRFLGHQATGRDITEEARLREEVEHERHKWRELFEQATVGIFLADREHRIVESNPAAVEMLGYSREELRGMSASEFVHPDDLEYVQAALSELVAYQQERHRVEYRSRCADGGYIWMETDGSVIKDEEGNTRELLFSTRDITGRKRIEKDLVEREALYRNLMENSIDGVSLLDEEGRFLDVNRRECEMTGYSKEELLQMSVADIDPNYPADGFYSFWKEKPRGDSILFETVHRHKDGTLIPVEVNGICFEVNEKRYLYGVARDISERRQLEEKLRESEQSYRFLADNVQDIVWLRDVAGEFATYVSPSIEKVLGYTPEEALSMRARDLQTEESYARQRAILDDLVDRGLSTSGPVEHVAIHKDGHTVPIEVNPSLIRDEAGRLTRVVSVVRDISERKQVEAELEAERSLLRNVLHNAPGGLFVKDRESRFITANATALASLGVDTVDEIVGKSDFEFFSEEFAQRTYAAEQEIIATGDPRINEERPDIDETGARRWLMVSRFPFIDETSGAIKGIIGTWHDITENRRQRDRLETALQEKQLLMRELNHRVKNNL
ncbi:MAG: PAS domain S-box protein, partial [Spirochaetia bacterium]